MVIKKYLAEIIVVLVVLTIVLIGYKSNIKLSKDNKNKKEIIENIVDNPIIYSVNKDSTISAQTRTIETLRSNLDLIVDERVKDKVKIKNLQSLQQIKYVVKDSFIVKLKDSTRYKDSFTIEKFAYFDYVDKYLREHCEINDSGVVICSYEYKDSVTVLIKLVKQYKWYQFWKWGKKDSFTEVIFNNPRASAIQVKSIIVTK